MKGVQVVLTDSKYGVDNWWTDRNAIMRVVQEYVKLGYYVVTGRA